MFWYMDQAYLESKSILIQQIDYVISGFVDDTKEIGTSILYDLKVSENRETLEKKLLKEPNFTRNHGLILAIVPGTIWQQDGRLFAGVKKRGLISRI